MTAGIGVETLGLLLRVTMSREAAETVKRRFTEMGAKGEDVSYLDCVLFDAALDALGMEQEYYRIPDEEWQATLNQRMASERCYGQVKTVDVTDACLEALAANRN